MRLTSARDASRFLDRFSPARLRSGGSPSRRASPALFAGLVVGLLGLAAFASPAEAARPRNPYSSFNLSGINYGAMQWERAQRQGRRVWPYYNTPGRGVSGYRGSTYGGQVSAGSSTRSMGGTRIIRSR
jgi:hypothetical protein